MCNTETSSYKRVSTLWKIKKTFHLKTIYFEAGKRHTDLKLCVDRTGSIPTACPYISSMCWNGKYAIDLCALVLYSNISNEWQNKRGTVCYTRGEVQYKEARKLHAVCWHFIVYHFKSKWIFVFHKRILLTHMHLELILDSLKYIGLIYCFALQRESLLKYIVVKCCKKYDTAWH